MLYELSYENERGQEIKFGGLKYGFVDATKPGMTTKAYRLNKFEGFGEVGGDIQRQKAPYQNGSTHIDTLLDERPLFIEFTMQADDFNELSAMRREVGRIFNPKVKGTLTILYGDDEYEIDCISEHVPTFTNDGLDAVGHTQVGFINFIALNPYWRTPSITEEPAFEELFQFPSVPYWEEEEDGDLYFEMGMQRNDRIIINDGDAAAPLKIDFYGPADSPIIENLTTGEFIKINKKLEENQVLKIDTTDGVKSVVYMDEDGDEMNVFHWIDLSSTFFKLQIGENDITCHCAISNNQKDFDISYSKLYNAV